MSKSLAEKLTERELITVNENDQLLDAINKLVKYNIGAIPVINNRLFFFNYFTFLIYIKRPTPYRYKWYSSNFHTMRVVRFIINY